MAKWPAMAVAAATAGETRWVRPPRPCRPSKLRLRGGGAALARGELVGVHRQAHRAARAPASRSRRRGTPGRSPSASAWAFTACEPGTTRVRTPSATCRPSRDLGHGTQVLDAAVGAGADEDRVDRRRLERGAGRRPMYSSARSAALRSTASSKSVGGGDHARHGDDLAGVGAPRHERLDVGGVEEHLLVEGGALVGGQACASRPPRRPTARPRGRAGGPAGSRR